MYEVVIHSYSTQPLTKVNTLQDYDMAMQRFRLTITIPYVGDKTGNYTFSSGIKSNNNSIFSEDWIYIYFKSKWHLHIRKILISFKITYVTARNITTLHHWSKNTEKRVLGKSSTSWKNPYISPL